MSQHRWRDDPTPSWTPDDISFGSSFNTLTFFPVQWKYLCFPIPVLRACKNVSLNIKLLIQVIIDSWVYSGVLYRTFWNMCPENWDWETLFFDHV